VGHPPIGAIQAAIQSSRNKQTQSQLEGLQRTIEEHFGRIANAPNDPQGQDKWKKDIRGYIKQQKEKVERLTSKLKQIWEQLIRTNEGKLNDLP
jgi:chromosome segregation ATPase